jgi:hypothetical protein
MELDLKIFRMNRLGIPQERIAKRLEVDQKTIHNHLGKMPGLANLLKADLSRGFTVAQVAEKRGWTEPMVWSLALEGKDDLVRFKELNWGLRTWDLWNWNDCDRRFGDDWPGRIPGQLIAHILYYFSRQNDLVFDPMGGGGITPDVCLTLNRRCWTLDMVDQPDTRPEVGDTLGSPIKGPVKRKNTSPSKKIHLFFACILTFAPAQPRFCLLFRTRFFYSIAKFFYSLDLCLVHYMIITS